jgi:dTDP-4-dehydrorhamnose 3,5-epimerase
MRVLAPPMPDVVLLELAVFDDERGRFYEVFHRARYAAAGIALEFVQDNCSSSPAGTLRGLHYQRRAPQGKLVWVTRGEVFDVAVDLRPGPGFGTWAGTTLSAANHRQLWIPPGFAHGFLVTSADADLAYKVTAPYAADDQHAVRWDDPALAIAWPLTAPPRLSPRDRDAPGLAEVSP